MKYKKPSKKSGRNKTTKPNWDLDPSGAIGSAEWCAPAELKVFDKLGVASEHAKESYLAVFSACWLCKFVFPKDDVNFFHPRVFKVATKMVTGESFSLAILVLANIYDGLSTASNSASIKDCVVVLPNHYVYGWLGEHFGTHFSSSTLDKSRYSSSNVAKQGLSAKSLDDLQAQVLFRSCEGLRMDHLARVCSARRGVIDIYTFVSQTCLILQVFARGMFLCGKETDVLLSCIVLTISASSLALSNMCQACWRKMHSRNPCKPCICIGSLVLVHA